MAHSLWEFIICVCVQYCSDAECEGGSRGGDKGAV